MVFKWATVTGISPLRIKLDGDTTAIPTTPDSLIDPATLAVDDRVRTELSGNRLVVLGRVGGNSKRTAFTPSWLNWTTPGNSTVMAYETISSGICFVELSITVGSTANAWGDLGFFRPTGSAMGWDEGPLAGSVSAKDVSVGKRFLMGAYQLSFSTNNTFIFRNFVDGVDTAPFTPAVGDKLQCNISYAI